ncbi:MAG: nuclease-related domain-containing protein [Acidimicrobiales bacterium]
MILHDRRVPGSPANIDHLVIGPNGVFVVDAKNFSHQLSLDKGTLWTGRYPVKLSSTRNQAERAETALASALVGHTVEVLPFVCVVGSARLPRRTVDLDGVRVVSDWQMLLTEIRKRPAVLTDAEVERLSMRAEDRMPPR